MARAEFDGALVLGTITGHRVFNIDKLGRLRSPVQNTIIIPGENRAECEYRPHRTGHKFTMEHLTPEQRKEMEGYRDDLSKPYPDPGWYVPGEEKTQTKLRTDEQIEQLVNSQYGKKRAGALNCSCGFYSYFSPNERFSGTIDAVIEGWGIVTIGTKGFRSEKMRVLAMARPYNPIGAFFARQGQRIPSTVGWGSLFAGIAAGVTGLITAAIIPTWISLVLFVLAPFFGLVANARATYERWISKPYDAPSRWTLMKRFEKTKKLYPEITIYPSRKALHRAHSFTQPEPPKIPTPDDADFWTRDAII